MHDSFPGPSAHSVAHQHASGQSAYSSTDKLLGLPRLEAHAAMLTPAASKRARLPPLKPSSSRMGSVDTPPHIAKASKGRRSL